MNSFKINEDDIEISSFTSSDIEPYLDYWYSSDSHHLIAMGVNPQELPSRKVMRQMLSLRAIISGNDQQTGSKIVCICVDNISIGVHELTDFNTKGLDGNEHRSAVMHAHIWLESYRGMGIGLVSYVKAMKLFFERFALDEILFETPQHNYAANSIKRRLGMMPYSRGTYSFPLANRRLDTFRYRVKLCDLPDLENRMTEAFREKHMCER